MSQSRGRIGVAAVILGVIALGLAIISRAIFDVPPPWPTQPVAEPQHVVEGGKTLEWKGARITIGGTTKVVAPPPPPSPPVSSKVVFIATAIVSLIGIAAGLIASWRDRSYMLGGPAVALCSMALLWHYILIAVTVAIAFFIIVAILASLAGAIPA